MGAKKQEEKQGFWARYRFYIIGFVGAILLIGSMSVQNIVLNYKTPDGTQYAAKLDYSAFGMCLRCNGTTDNAANIVEKAFFFGAGKETSVDRAAAALVDIAGTEDGTLQIHVGGVLGMLGGNDKLTDEMMELLQELGYTVEVF